MAHAAFWQKLRGEFLEHAVECDDLIARWRPAFGKWILWGGAANGTCMANASGDKLFQAVARKAAYRLWQSRDADSWALWLDFMRREGWRYSDFGSPQPVPRREWEEMAKSERPLCDVQREFGHSTSDEAAITEVGGWLQEGVIEHVFKASADFCIELDSREQAGPPRKRIREEPIDELLKQRFVEYLSSYGLRGRARIAVPRSLIVEWMAEVLGTQPWNVTFAALQHACEELSRHEGSNIEISYRQTKYVQLSTEERQLLKSGAALGTEEDRFVLFAVGGLTGSAFRDPEIWLDIKSDFEKLAGTLRRLRRPRDERLLAAYASDDESLWEFSGIAPADLREQCEEICTRAGIALGCPAEKKPSFFWLGSLREYLAATASPYLHPTGVEEGIIVSVVEGSLSYCSWLSREARERQHARANSAGIKVGSPPFPMTESKIRERAQRRQQFLQPILDSKTMTVNQWADDVHVRGIAHSTVFRYWNGETDPRIRTRSALAAPLGLRAADLPR